MPSLKNGGITGPFLLSAAVFQVDEIDFHFTPSPVNNGTARIMVLFKGGKYPDPWVVHALAIFCGRSRSGRARSGVKYPEACLGDSLTGSKKFIHLPGNTI